MTFGLYSKEKADQIREFVERHDEVDGDQSFENEVTKEPVWFFVKMVADLAASTEPLAGYTQAKAKILKYKYDSDTTLDREVVPGIEDEINITNRSSNSLSSEETAWVRLIGAEYVPFLGGGSILQFMGFTITEDDCPAGQIATDLNNVSFFSGCGEPPGMEYGGGYIINDFFGLLANLSDAPPFNELKGKRALAIYWNSYPDCIPRWDVILISWSGGCVSILGPS